MIRCLLLLTLVYNAGAEIEEEWFLLATETVDVLTTGGIDTLLDYDVITHLGGRPLAVDYHFGLDEAFALVNNSYYIFRFPLPTSWARSQPPQEMTVYANCGTFAVDWVHDHLIWPVCTGPPRMLMVTLNGSEEIHTLTVLPSSHPSHVTDMAVDPYASVLFWITRRDLMSCGLDGRNLKTLRTLFPNPMNSLALDLNERRVYVSVWEPAGIYHMEYSGTTFERVESLSYWEDSGPWILSVFRSRVYFVSHLPQNRSAVYRVDGNRVQEVFRHNSTILDMKVVNWQFQTAPAVGSELCTDLGCAHHCEVVDQVARCRCVRGFTLEDDQTHCRELPGGPSTLDVIFLGLIGVLTIVLVAGVLMFMADKLWSKVRPRAVLIYSRRPPAETTPDDDRLV